MKPGVAFGVLLENLADDGDGILMHTQYDWCEGFALLKYQAVFAQKVGCLKQRLDLLGGGSRLFYGLWECFDAVRTLAFARIPRQERSDISSHFFSPPRVRLGLDALS